jgi:PTH1 family peptidyl-tRNA hydrolase
LFVGLGNPGPKYSATRHNLGFRVLDVVARGHALAPWKRAFHGEVTQADIRGCPTLLLKPGTYMNASGQAVAAALAAEAFAPDTLCVVHDDVDLQLGRVRLKKGGGDAGHRGLASIREHLGQGDYLRLRLGVGRPPADFEGTLADFLLEAFAPAEQLAVRDMLSRSVDAVVSLVESGPSATMNSVNQRNKS